MLKESRIKQRNNKKRDYQHKKKHNKGYRKSKDLTIDT